MLPRLRSEQSRDNTAGDGEPAWLPDGTKIAFTSDRDGNAEVYVMNANGSGQTNLTNNLAIDGEPSWGPIVLTKAQCSKGGWKALGFKNQGQCVSQTT